jgi:hypothetical protein
LKNRRADSARYTSNMLVLFSCLAWNKNLESLPNSGVVG